MTPLEILRAARERLADPARWLHGQPSGHAVDASGHDVSPWSPEAARWDLPGALLCHELPRSRSAVFRLVASAVGPWNYAPERTHAEVLAVLDRAIELAKEAA